MLSVIAHYQELALKGKNRPWFVHRLVRNIRFALAGLDVRDVRRPMGRIEIVLGSEDLWPEVRERLSRVFGLANFSLARRVPLGLPASTTAAGDVETIADALVRDLPDTPVESFRIA